MNPLFQPGMIRGHDEEEGHKAGQDEIAGAVPAGFVERDDAKKAGDEDRQAPFGEPGAGARSLIDETTESCDQALELGCAGKWSHRLGDLTGSLECRQRFLTDC